METKEKVRQELLNSYDADILVDLLKIDAEELLDRFEDKLDEYVEDNKDGDEDED